jgi:hypothetical protein
MKLHHIQLFAFWVNILGGYLNLVLQPTRMFWLIALCQGAAAICLDIAYTYGEDV